MAQTLRISIPIGGFLFAITMAGFAMQGKAIAHDHALVVPNGNCVHIAPGTGELFDGLTFSAARGGLERAFGTFQAPGDPEPLLVSPLHAKVHVGQPGQVFGGLGSGGPPPGTYTPGTVANNPVTLNWDVGGQECAPAP